MVAEQDIEISKREQVLESLKEVMDPEIPVLSVVDLGIIERIELADDAVRISMIPTFTACPAIHLMRREIKEKIIALGFEQVEVEIDKSVPWTSDRITKEGKEKLKNFGLGTSAPHKGKFGLEEIEHTKCPHCGSPDTTLNSLFGSTLCRSLHFCFSCKQSFERFKPL